MEKRIDGVTLQNIHSTEFTLKLRSMTTKIEQRTHEFSTEVKFSKQTF